MSKDMTPRENEAYLEGKDLGSESMKRKILSYLAHEQHNWACRATKYVDYNDWDAVEWASRNAAVLQFYINELSIYLDEGQQ